MSNAGKAADDEDDIYAANANEFLQSAIVGGVSAKGGSALRAQDDDIFRQRQRMRHQ